MLIHDWIAQRAQTSPDRIVLEDGASSTTAGQLEALACGVAHALYEAGARPGDRVVLRSCRSEQLIAATLGVLKARCVFVPLDAGAASSDRLWTQVARLRPRWAIVEGGADASSRWDATLVPGGGVLTFEGCAGLAGRPFEAETPAGEDDPAYVYFTSGSTGEPRAIVGRLGAIAPFMRWAMETFGLSPGWRLSLLASPSYDAWLVDALLPLCVGGTACVAPADRSPEHLARWLDEAGIQCVHTVPSILRTLLLAPGGAGHLSALEMLWLAGEPLFPADVRAWTARFGARPSLINLYGASETTLVRFFHRVRPEDADRPHVPVGRPIPHTSFFLVGPDGRECAPGASGEIHIESAHVSLGYDEAGANADVFVADPRTGIRPDTPIYRTGDVGYVIPGEDLLVVTGRMDRQIKVRGTRISLEEVEHHLLRADGVREAAVIDRRDRYGLVYLCAYLVPTAPGALDASALRASLSAELPAAMVPSAFVLLDRLPVTSTGKVDRGALPDHRTWKGRRPRVAPRDEIERAMVGMWRKTLQLGEVGVTESFWDLGGHSLLLLVLVDQLRAAFGCELSVHRLLGEATIEGHAALVREALGRSPDAETLVADSPRLLTLGDGPGEPLVCIHPPIGNAACYTALARRLAGQRACLAVEDPTGRSFDSLVDQASHYLRMVTAHLGSPPRLLCGWSSGGIIAFEMACQVERQGLAPPALLLIDTFAPIVRGTGQSSMDTQGGLLLEQLIAELLHGVEGMLAMAGIPDLRGLLARTLAPAFDIRLPPERRATLADIRLVNALTQSLAGLLGRALPTLPEPDPALPPEAPSHDADAVLRFMLALGEALGAIPQLDYEALQRTFLVYRHNMTLMRGYRAAETALRGSLSLVRTREADGYPNATRGWDRLVQGSIEVTSVLDDHFSWMQEPQVAAVQAAVQALVGAHRPLPRPETHVTTKG